jgi:hypothetical protein
MAFPRLILQEILDDLGSAVMTDDWAGFVTRIDLPFEMDTDSTTITVVSRDDLRDGYDRFRELIQLRRVTDYIRLAETATYDTPDTIRGVYVSHLLSNGTRVLPPYRSEMTLRLRGNRWTVTRIRNTWTNDRWPILTPSPSGQEV